MSSLTTLNEQDRRTFLKTSVAAGTVLLTLGNLPGSCVKKSDDEEVETTPNEDLMREHGLLRRVLLVYDENLKGTFNGKVVQAAANIVRDFIEDYHEQLEEQYIFPVLKDRLSGLVAILTTQHKIGREITKAILNASLTPTSQEKAHLEQMISDFKRMYEAHAAREDTDLFPAFKNAVGEKRYKELGEIFENEEDKRFGDKGFEGMLSLVSELEKDMNISDLNVYTPKMP
jgi:hemerythrin-like domain-containing protein